MLTVSNALVMSSDVMIVRMGGFLWLKPEATTLLILCSAVLVECSFLKPCWKGSEGTNFVMIVRMIFSSVLARGERREIGL